MTATNSERSFNEALARVLWTKHPSWRETLAAEQHGAVKGGGMPDLIVRNPLGAPVVIETEYPAGPDCRAGCGGAARPRTDGHRGCR